MKHVWIVYLNLLIYLSANEFPKFKINLDKDAKERFEEIVSFFGDKIIEPVEYFKQFAPKWFIN